MTVKEQIKEIKAQFRLAMNGAVSHSMRKRGLNYKLNFGIELPRIKMIAAKYEPNHELAQELWKEEIRESKILATLLQPIDSFFPEIADIWVLRIDTIEIAEIACMNLFQKLPYAQTKSFQWIASDQEYVQTCGFLTLARLLVHTNLDNQSENEFIDQAITAACSDEYHVRNAALLAMKKYINKGRREATLLLKDVEKYSDSSKEHEQNLYRLVQNEIQYL